MADLTGFLLDPTITHLNHGSFSACPEAVLERSFQWRRELERDPLAFLAERLPDLLDEVRRELGDFLGANPEDLALLANATTAVNVVARSLHLESGDEVLLSDHEYPSAVRALEDACARAGARTVTARVGLPVSSAEQVVQAYARGLTDRTRLILVSHITSPTALVFPVDKVAALGRERGVPVLVDGAHAPAHIPLDLRALDADYYAGNGHKWLMAPKGTGFLHARKDRQSELRPLVVHHRELPPGSPPAGLATRFDWQGTWDPCAVLALPAAIQDHRARGGVETLLAHGRRLCNLTGDRLAAAGLEPVQSDDPGLTACMRALALPPDAPADLSRRLFQAHRIHVPLPLCDGRRLLRVSCPLYVDEGDIHKLARALERELGS